MSARIQEDYPELDMKALMDFVLEHGVRHGGRFRHAGHRPAGWGLDFYYRVEVRADRASPGAHRAARHRTLTVFTSPEERAAIEADRAAIPTTHPNPALGTMFLRVGREDPDDPACWIGWDEWQLHSLSVPGRRGWHADCGLCSAPSRYLYLRPDREVLGCRDCQGLVTARSQLGSDYPSRAKYIRLLKSGDFEPVGLALSGHGADAIGARMALEEQGIVARRLTIDPLHVRRRRKKKREE